MSTQVAAPLTHVWEVLVSPAGSQALLGAFLLSILGLPIGHSMIAGSVLYLLLAGLSTPLVLSVHSIVSFDFAVSQVPGWHTTIFPPYFVAGAIFSGFAMVVTLMVIMRKAFGLEHIITMKHFDYMAKIMLLTGMMVGYAYGRLEPRDWNRNSPARIMIEIGTTSTAAACGDGAAVRAAAQRATGRMR